ncbi:MAG: TetR/AcrR family transcriptional regulator [Ilumatobacteraceae bacterium]
MNGPLTLGIATAAPKPSRREQLLEIAASLFAERGFAKVTMDDIGAAAGVSGPALYHHFTGKEAMLGEMLISISEWLLARGRERVAEADAGDPATALRGLISDHVSFSAYRPELITIHFRDLVATSDADRRRVTRVQSQYANCWVDLLRRTTPGIEKDVARAVVHAVFGLLNSTPHISRPGREATAALLASLAEATLATVGT